jgi:hypothetical protein
MSIATDIARSREYEMRVYLSSMKAMYENALIQNGEIYDVAAQLTADFQTIAARAILADSRIIKILRYAIAPSISQMKFGQFFGITSIDAFENDRVSPRSGKYRTLTLLAPKIARFASQNLDRHRFLWLDSRFDNDVALAQAYAKGWTCSIAADQNAQTKYRNWRKEQQEQAIAAFLVAQGYTKSSFTGVITKRTDINLGEYTQEIRVKGRTRQKADLAVRSKKSKRLVLIEAKAVGVEIDATKRIKECCDKAGDWQSSPALDLPAIVTVIAGFFNRTGLANLRASTVQIVWEHRLADLGKLL